MKSSFGERFIAEVELITDSYDGVVVTIGSEQEYKDKGVKWGDVIYDLKIKEPLISRDGKRFIQVVSGNPLFQPSFNLLLKAERTNGPVFENYFISVDFQDSVSLKGVRAGGKEKGTIGKPVAPKIISKPAPADPGEEFSDSGILGHDGKEKSIVARVPTPFEVREINPPPAMKAFPKPLPKDTDEIDEAPKVKPKPSRRPKKKFVPFDEMLTDYPTIPGGSLNGKKYGPLKPGEDLEKVARSLNFGASEFSRVAVALWMDNSDKFIKGNIHGLKAGVTLDIGNLEKRMGSLSFDQADQIIKDHWNEWKTGASPSVPDKEQNSPVEEALLEIKNERSIKEDLSGLIIEWQDSWINEDLDRHMALFHKGSAASPKGRGFGYWRQFKKKMFKRHDNVQLDIQNQKFIPLKNKARVEFDQVFESDQMKSSGRKTIDFARSGSEWKIIKEDFEVKEFIGKKKPASQKTEKIIASTPIPEKSTSPIVILVSTLPDFNAAIEMVNELRKMGFGAYASPVYEEQELKSYKVFVGRFSNMDLAKELAQTLENFNSVEKAIPVNSPYVLQVGEFVEKENAENQARKIRAKGFPPFLFHTRDKKSSSSITRVFVGTFEDRKNAMKMAQDLTRRGVISMVKEP